MDSLEIRLDRFQFRDLQGKEAVEQAYQYATDRLREPRTERAVIEDALMPREVYQQIFNLYFQTHKEEALQVAKAHEMNGWRKFYQPLTRLLWSNCKKEELEAAVRYAR